MRYPSGLPQFLERVAAGPGPGAVASRLTSGRVRLKRGAGAGCTTPPTSTNALRVTLWGCFGASASDSTGAKQTSDPSMMRHHSSRVLVRITPRRDA